MEPKLNHDMEEKYVVYKRATSTVIRWLLNHSKHTCELTDESIKMMDLISLAQGVKASSVTAWGLSRLRTAIRLRREVARYFQATAADVEDAVRKESNLSHDVMVQILERALHSLYKYLPPSQASQRPGQFAEKWLDHILPIDARAWFWSMERMFEFLPRGQERAAGPRENLFALVRLFLHNVQVPPFNDTGPEHGNLTRFLRHSEKGENVHVSLNDHNLLDVSPLTLSGARSLYMMRGEFYENKCDYMLPWLLCPKESETLTHRAAFEHLEEIWYSGKCHPHSLVFRGLMQEHKGQKGESAPHTIDEAIDAVLRVSPPRGGDVYPLRYHPVSSASLNNGSLDRLRYDKEAHPAFDRALPIPFTRFCMVKLWCKCAGILGRVYSKYEPLVKQDLEAGNIKLSVHEQEFRRLFHSAGELKGGQKCASVVEKTLAVLELPKKSKQRLKMPPSQQKLPEIWAEALKSIDDWKAEDFLWRSMAAQSPLQPPVSHNTPQSEHSSPPHPPKATYIPSPDTSPPHLSPAQPHEPKAQNLPSATPPLQVHLRPNEADEQTICVPITFYEANLRDAIE
ncbi:MAG: hypothetical protein Q9159_000172 [Coniocarpon cinnabarinum]